MKRVFTKLACAAMAAVMTISCAPTAELGFMPKLAVEASAAEQLIAEGKNETVYAEWLPISGATSYEAYVKASSSGSYTQVDDQLLRQYATYWRVDVPGCSAGTYDLKIVAKNGSSVVTTLEKTGISVNAYKREGFAFSKQSKFGTASGAYNDDGTLKSNAKVFYVTKDTAKTITADVATASNKTETFTGLQAIITAKQKGYDLTPYDFRIIGTINDTDLDGMDSSEEGLQIKGKNAYSELNITIEGIGNDAAINGFGMLIRNAGNVELRNFAVINCMDDCISIDTTNCNLWIHHLDFFYGKVGGDSDQAKGDGTTDVKGLSTYITISNNHYWDSGKTSLCGMGNNDKYGDYCVTYAYNWFDHSDSRHPRTRGGSVHVYNNYYDGNAKYGVGVTTGSSTFAENNYFRNCKNPMLISRQGTDALGDGTFSGEDGGYIKEYGNIMVGSYYFLPNEDAYCASSRNEQVPASWVAKVVNSGVVYNNFDTDSTMYSYTPLAAKDVPAYVVENAGRLNCGNFNWNFDNSSEDGNYDLISGLKAAVTNYTPVNVSVGGTVTTVTGSASSLTGIDGYERNYDPVEKLTSLNLPTETDTSGNKSTGGSTDPVTETTTKNTELTTAESTTEATTSAPVVVPEGGVSHNFTENGLVSSFYTITGNLSTSKGTTTYNELELIQCLKMESGTKITFNASSAGTLTLVFGGTTAPAGKSVKVDGTAYTVGTDNIATVELAAGSHTIEKGDAINLFYMNYASDSAGTSTQATTEAATQATTEAATEATTQAPVVTDGVQVTPAAGGSYSFTTAAKGTLTTTAGYGGAYADLNTTENNIEITANGAVLTDTSTTLATNLKMPLGKTYTSGTLTISGKVTPSKAASKWSYIDIQGVNGSVLKIGTDASTNNAISATVDANNANVYVSSSTAAAASEIAYTAVLDLTNKTATVTLGSDTLKVDLVNTSVDTLASTTSKSGARNITVGDITVTYEADPSAPSQVKGDADGTGTVDKADVQHIIQYAVGKIASVVQPEAADVNGDNKVTVADAYIISQKVLGIISSL